MTHPYREELAGRLEELVADHRRLATWNLGKNRHARAAFHHDAVVTLNRAQAIMDRLDRGER